MRWLHQCIYSSWNEYNGGLSEVVVVVVFIGMKHIYMFITIIIT